MYEKRLTSFLNEVKDLYLCRTHQGWQGKLYFYLTAEVAGNAEESHAEHRKVHSSLLGSAPHSVLL
jgi:hypothetical protein